MPTNHNIIIWDADVYGTPKDLNNKTLEQAKALVCTTAQPSEKLLAFARSVENYSQSHGVPWTISRHLVNFEARVKEENTAAYRFTLPDYNWHSLIKILLEVAREHDLVFLDEQMDLLSLPDGEIKPVRSAIYWLGILDGEEYQDDFPQTLNEFYQFFKAHINELFSEHDFVLTEDKLLEDDDEFYIKYTRQIVFGSHSISFSGQGGDGIFNICSHFRLVENNMIKIGQLSDFQYYIDVGGGGVLLDINNICYPNKTQFDIVNWKSLEELLLVVKQSALKWSDVALDIKGIDALLNGNIDKRVKKNVHQFTYMPYALIIAYLANNPDFEDLVVSLGQFGVNGKSWPVRTKTTPSIAWSKLVQYLRDEVKPLV
ncbi:MAG: hypothetical protein KDI39_06345 [Pseudomonadales bacterium]|nr:hypothetical protein [Pseudomonadales bacterium]